MAIDTSPRKTVGLGSSQYLGVSALAVTDHRGEQLEARTGLERGELLCNLLGALGRYVSAARGAVRSADVGVEYA